MTLRIKYWAAAILGLSGIALAMLVPGGPIETRSFAHINPITLGLFNTFLTTLVLSSLVLVYFVLKSERWAMIAAAVCGLSYLGVYGLDLAEIFPVSPDAMPPALLGIEVLGTILSLPLMVLSIQALQGLQPRTLAVESPLRTHIPPFQMPVAAMGMGLVALGIIAFATRSAMGV